MKSITAAQLAAWQGSPQPLLLLDVRRTQARTSSGVQIAGAQWHDPALWLDWKDDISARQPVVVYCLHGHEISQGLSATLQAMGVDACHLEGGIAAWQAQAMPVVSIATSGAAS